MSKRALICTNLIGDSIYLLGPVKKYLETHASEVSCIVVQKSIAGQLFVSSFAEEYARVVFSEEEAREIDPTAEFLRLEAGLAANICYAHARKHGRQLHISEGYARLLGVDIEGQICPPTDWQVFQSRVFEPDKKYALLCPFSASCSRHTGEKPNKTLDDWKWEPIIRFLRRHDYTVKVIGSPKERLSKCSIPESDYHSYTHSHFVLGEIESDFRKSSLVISVDNGMAHLASSFGVKTIVLWPVVSNVDFIAPVWSPKTALTHIGDPNTAPPAAILVGIRKMLAYLENGK